MLVDTNIFIDYLKGEARVKKFFSEEANLTTSIIVVMEVIVGLPKKADIKKLEKFLSSANIKVYQLDNNVSKQSYEFFCQHFHSSNISIPDAIIAATTFVNNEELATLNIKHYRHIKDIKVTKPY